MATQGYQEYNQGGYHSMPNGVPNHGHYEHWNHHQHSFTPPNDIRAGKNIGRFTVSDVLVHISVKGYK